MKNSNKKIWIDFPDRDILLITGFHRKDLELFKNGNLEQRATYDKALEEISRAYFKGTIVGKPVKPQFCIEFSEDEIPALKQAVSYCISNLDGVRSQKDFLDNLRPIAKKLELEHLYEY